MIRVSVSFPNNHCLQMPCLTFFLKASKFKQIMSSHVAQYSNSPHCPSLSTYSVQVCKKSPQSKLSYIFCREAGWKAVSCLQNMGVKLIPWSSRVILQQPCSQSPSFEPLSDFPSSSPLFSLFPLCCFSLPMQCNSAVFILAFAISW